LNLSPHYSQEGSSFAALGTNRLMVTGHHPHHEESSADVHSSASRGVAKRQRRTASLLLHLRSLEKKRASSTTVQGVWTDILKQIMDGFMDKYSNNIKPVKFSASIDS
jgi:hypothetical protein